MGGTLSDVSQPISSNHGCPSCDLKPLGVGLSTPSPDESHRYEAHKQHVAQRTSVAFIAGKLDRFSVVSSFNRLREALGYRIA
jgi:hypothetical protein